LTPAIVFWVFGSLGGLQIPIFGSVSGNLTLPLKWGCDRYYSRVCKHVKNQKLFAFGGCEYIATQVTHGVVRDNAKKVVQFAIVLHLL
jgi:hypothetical protein